MTNGIKIAALLLVLVSGWYGVHWVYLSVQVARAKDRWGAAFDRHNLVGNLVDFASQGTLDYYSQMAIYFLLAAGFLYGVAYHIGSKSKPAE